MAQDNKLYDVFISYSQKDRIEADKICKILDDHQITYFIDRQGLSGANCISEVIAEALLNSSVFLFLGSKNSYASNFANDEISFAKKHFEKTNILPYLLDSEPMPPGIELSLSDTLWRRKINEPFDPIVINDINQLLHKGQKARANRTIQTRFLKKAFVAISIILTPIILALLIKQFNHKERIDVKEYINSNIQETFDSLLVKRMAELGCPEAYGAVMDVSSGIPVAISSWVTRNGNFEKSSNKMFLELTDPGPVFEVVSYAALLEDGKITPDSIVDTGNTLDKPSIFNFHDIEVSDDHPVGIITAKEAIVHSSNIAIVKMVTDTFEDRPQDYLDVIANLGWYETPIMVFEGDTLRSSLVRTFNDMSWSIHSLGLISCGYEMRATPMHTLMFFNSIANNGVRPRIGRICSKKTADNVKEALDAVVEDGTARTRWSKEEELLFDGARSRNIHIAGKTGVSPTSTTLSSHIGHHSSDGHYVTFVGYFPAGQPKYSCLVTIKAIPGGNFGRPGGGWMAGPVVRQLAESIYFKNVNKYYN